MENISSANTRFALDLFRTNKISQPNSNAFLSPFSISIALSMTQLGAKTETAAGMAKALRWDDGKEAVIHDENQKYVALLQKPNDKFALSLANRLFIDQGFKVLPEFLQQTQKLYMAEAVAAGFQTNPEQERININSWVSKQTHDKIQNLLGEGDVNTLTRMVLVNAIYFKGLWEDAFDEHLTRQLPFKVSETETKNVQTMTAEKSYRFWNDDGQEGFSALELPYKGDELSLVILLPTSNFGLASMEKNLTVEKLTTLFSRLHRPRKVKVFLPRFEMTCSYQMKEPLSELGMSLAFDTDRADFSGMTGSKDLVVSAVIHKAFIKVDEKGSEAAAATAVTMMLRCARPIEETPKFVVDHPFLFVIRDKRASNSILFMGKVIDPSL